MIGLTVYIVNLVRPKKDYKSEGLIRAYSEYESHFNDSRFSSILVQGVHDSIRSIKLRAKFGPNLGVVNQSGKVKLDLTVGLNSTYEQLLKTKAYLGI